MLSSAPRCFSLVVNIVFKNSNKDRLKKKGGGAHPGITPSGAQDQIDGGEGF